MHPARLHPVLPRCLALLLLLAAPVGPLGAQAVVTWDTPAFISGDSDITFSGSLVLAYNLTDESGNTTVNGITFTGVTGSTSALTFTTEEDSFFYTDSVSFASGSPPFTDLSGGYQVLLQSAAYWDLNDTSVVNRMTLNNLLDGNLYHLRLWVNDSRGDYSDRVNLISDGEGHEVQLRFDDGSYTSSLGQYVTGTFVAEGTTQDILLSAHSGNTIQLNALILSTSAIPEPSTYAALAGLVALGLASLRRRRSA